MKASLRRALRITGTGRCVTIDVSLTVTDREWLTGSELTACAQDAAERIMRALPGTKYADLSLIDIKVKR